LNKLLIITDPRLKNGDLFFGFKKLIMNKPLRKKGKDKTGKNKDLPKVKRSDTATGVNENHKSIFRKRLPFTDEFGTDTPK
jgi:hypothetical protein